MKFQYLFDMNKPFTMKVKVITVITLIFIVVDVGFSGLACYRQKERVEEIQAKNNLDKFLDKHYPDEKIDKIYTNKILKVTNIP